MGSALRVLFQIPGDLPAAAEQVRAPPAVGCLEEQVSTGEASVFGIKAVGSRKGKKLLQNLSCGGMLIVEEERKLTKIKPSDMPRRQGFLSDLPQPGSRQTSKDGRGRYGARARPSVVPWVSSAPLRRTGRSTTMLWGLFFSNMCWWIALQKYSFKLNCRKGCSLSATARIPSPAMPLKHGCFQLPFELTVVLWCGC